MDAIVTATARLLEQGPFSRATSARIARTAGVSVGSVYQYFPSREALLLEVARRHAAALAASLRRSLESLDPAEPVDRLARRLVQAAVDAHALAPALHRSLVREAARLGHPDVARDILDTLVAALAAVLASHPRLAGPRPEVRALVVVRAVDLLTHALVVDEPGRVAPQVLVEELGAMVAAYLLTPRPAPGGASG